MECEQGLSAVAARNQIDVLSIAEGYLQSSVLFALLRLNVFELIEKDSRTIHELSQSTCAPAGNLARLLSAGVALNLLESDDRRMFRLSATSKSVLVRSAGRYYICDWIRHLDSLQPAMYKLDEAVRGVRPTLDLWSQLVAARTKLENSRWPCATMRRIAVRSWLGFWI